MSKNAFPLTPENHRALKQALAEGYPGLSASNRAEALARGLGFRTNAALCAALPTSPVVTVDPDAFLAFSRVKCAVADAKHFGRVMTRQLFTALPPDGPRWVLLAPEEGGPCTPCVTRRDLGMARAVPRGGPPGWYHDADQGFRVLSRADQAAFDLVGHSGTDAPWHRYFWTFGQHDILAGHEDGTPMRMVLAGMGNMIFDLGAYVGERPWPESP